MSLPDWQSISFSRRRAPKAHAGVLGRIRSLIEKREYKNAEGKPFRVDEHRALAYYTLNPALLARARASLHWSSAAKYLLSSSPSATRNLSNSGTSEDSFTPFMSSCTLLLDAVTTLTSFASTRSTIFCSTSLRVTLVGSNPNTSWNVRGWSAATATPICAGTSSSGMTRNPSFIPVI